MGKLKKLFLYIFTGMLFSVFVCLVTAMVEEKTTLTTSSSNADIKLGGDETEKGVELSVSSKSIQKLQNPKKQVSEYELIKDLTLNIISPESKTITVDELSPSIRIFVFGDIWYCPNTKGVLKQFGTQLRGMDTDIYYLDIKKRDSDKIIEGAKTSEADKYCNLCEDKNNEYHNMVWKVVEKSGDNSDGFIMPFVLIIGRDNETIFASPFQGSSIKTFVQSMKDSIIEKYPDEKEKPADIVQIEIVPASVSLNAGEKKKLSVNLVPDNADLRGLTWHSTNPEIVTINENGEITAVAEGEAEVYCSVADRKDIESNYCKVQVNASDDNFGNTGESSNPGSGSGGNNSSSSTPGGPGSSLPSYVVKGEWSILNGFWHFTDASGNACINNWVAAYNPYAVSGQQNYDWFRFDPFGNMLTGWFIDADGSRYYLNPLSDGTLGKMMTGWVWIADETGVQRCYYLNPNSDGYRGKMLTNTVIDGYTIDAKGWWVVDGVVQVK